MILRQIESIIVNEYHMPPEARAAIKLHNMGITANLILELEEKRGDMNIPTPWRLRVLEELQHINETLGY